MIVRRRDWYCGYEIDKCAPMVKNVSNYLSMKMFVIL